MKGEYEKRFWQAAVEHERSLGPTLAESIMRDFEDTGPVKNEGTKRPGRVRGFGKGDTFSFRAYCFIQQARTDNNLALSGELKPPVDEESDYQYWG